jgi:hypothetical protein
VFNISFYLSVINHTANVTQQNLSFGKTWQIAANARKNWQKLAKMPFPAVR